MDSREKSRHQKKDTKRVNKREQKTNLKPKTAFTNKTKLIISEKRIIETKKNYDFWMHVETNINAYKTFLAKYTSVLTSRAELSTELKKVRPKAEYNKYEGIDFSDVVNVKLL